MDFEIQELCNKRETTTFLTARCERRQPQRGDLALQDDKDRWYRCKDYHMLPSGYSESKTEVSHTDLGSTEQKWLNFEVVPLIVIILNASLLVI